ncbi:MAG: AAA family ATPase [Bacteroidaceae bacterium]|nr:AAA family ATPase [Bacteroidaceae bacterium]
MATYINPGNKAFESAINGTYVDKTGLIEAINGTLFKKNRFSCVSRCRRFGKSMAAEMLCAYYDRSCDSRELFRGLQIERDPHFERHLNRYLVIYIDMSRFVTDYGHDNDIVQYMQEAVADSIAEAYPDVDLSEPSRLMDVLVDVAIATGRQFFMIIDEWDAICREFSSNEKAMDEYVKLLQRMFQSAETLHIFAGVYMTGIFPIMKYQTESALSNFTEYTMVRPGRIAPYFGFTRDEVTRLCQKHEMDFEEVARWYDGYHIGDEPSMFNPHSVMQAIGSRKCRGYWSATASFGAVRQYIQLDYEGLKGDIVQMLGGGRCRVDTTHFENDPHRVLSKDDALTLLIHLGYLAYDEDAETCYIPNREVGKEMEGAIERNNWHEVTNAIRDSEELLDNLLYGEAEAVAAGVAKVHEECASILRYNNENALACVINLAFYAARSKYETFRELPAGRGFADIVFVPWRDVSLPAIVVELKWRQDAETALQQIRERHYPESLKEYVGEVILCGISYDLKTREHACVTLVQNCNSI